MQQEEVSKQKELIDVLNSEIATLNASLDSTKGVADSFQQRMDNDNKYKETLVKAKRDVKSLLDRVYKEAWNSHKDLASSPEKRREAACLALCHFDSAPEIKRIAKRYNFGDDEIKVLTDVWVFALAEYLE